MEVETYGKLVFLSKDGSEIEFPLDKSSVLIGRDPSCDIRMVNREISRKHAEIRLDEQRRVLVDSKGREPINVNGKAVTSPQELVTGDKIEVLLEGRSRVFYYYATGEDTVILPQRPPLARKNADMPMTSGVASPPAPVPISDRPQDAEQASPAAGLSIPRPPSKRRSIESPSIKLQIAPAQVTNDQIDATEHHENTCHAAVQLGKEPTIDHVPEVEPMPPAAPAAPLEAIMEEKTEDLRAEIESNQKQVPGFPQMQGSQMPCDTPEGAPEPVDFTASGFSKRSHPKGHSTGIDIADSTIAFAEWAKGDSNALNLTDQPMQEAHDAQQMPSVAYADGGLSGGLRAPAPTPVTIKKFENDKTDKNDTAHMEVFNHLGGDLATKLASLAEAHDVEFHILASPPQQLPPAGAASAEHHPIPNTQNSSRRAIVAVTPKSAGISHSVRQVSLIKKTPWDENMMKDDRSLGSLDPLDQGRDVIATSNLKSARRLASALENAQGLSEGPRLSFQGKEKTPAGTKIALLLCSAAKSQQQGRRNHLEVGGPTPRTAASCRVVFDAPDVCLPKKQDGEEEEGEDGCKQNAATSYRKSPKAKKAQVNESRDAKSARAYRAHAAVLARRLQGTMARALRLKRVVRALAGSLKRERQWRRELQAQLKATIQSDEQRNEEPPVHATYAQRVVVVRPRESPTENKDRQPANRVLRAGCVVVVRPPSSCATPKQPPAPESEQVSVMVTTPKTATPGTSGTVATVGRAIPNTVVVVPATVYVQSGRHAALTRHGQGKEEEEEEEEEEVRRALMVADAADGEEELEAAELQSLERQVLDLVSQEAKNNSDDLNTENQNEHDDVEEDEIEEGEEDDTFCHVCNTGEEGDVLLLCDGCEVACHLACATPPLKRIPKGDWYCRECATKRARLEDKNNKSKTKTKSKSSEASKAQAKTQAKRLKTELSSKDTTKSQNSKKSRSKKDDPKRGEPEGGESQRPARRQRR